MLSKRDFRAGAVCAIIAIGVFRLAAQDTPPAQGGRGGGRRGAGGFVPGQQRPPEDPARIARGKTLYGVNCTGCHGADLRGGDMGGPNLLRSQVALSDKDGELIVPIIEGSRQEGGMPAINMPPDDAKTVAAYVRSVLETIGRQGIPPSAQAPPTVLIGDAAAGKAYFTAKCASCHSTTGDLEGIANRIADPKMLQNTWVAGGGRGGRGGRGAPAAPGAPDRRAITATVILPSGESVQGRVLRIDDFLVSLGLDDGSVRSFRRAGDVPRIELHDPMKIHHDLLSVYTDKDMHDVTAYLESLK
jgi:cytochrome c oxidase cbb3-type subunit 3